MMDANQQLALYRAQFPGLVGGQMTAQPGANTQAGAAAGIGKIIAALMQQQAMKKYQQQYGQQKPAVPNTVPPVDMAQGQTLSSPTPGIGDGFGAGPTGT